ncbi:hypothetical protein BDV10DRAFT_179994 [Aspergillus recurvatus]
MRLTSLVVVDRAYFFLSAAAPCSQPRQRLQPTPAAPAARPDGSGCTSAARLDHD